MALRRRQPGQLQRPERVGGERRFQPCGADGELLQGQEDQLSALGLVVNVIVLWNTIYMDAVVAQLRKEGFPVHDEDVARLSPFGHGHINLLGRYSFVVPESVTRGELRPLQRPSHEP